jgi:RNA polymerase sigma-70 factor (ECF subfamily)
LGARAPFGPFEQAVLPHLDAAYNLARWLTANDHDAEDVVQEASLRALEFFASFRGGDGKAWLLAIVRNTCFSWLERNRPRQPTTRFDETMHSNNVGSNPPQALLKSEDRDALAQAIEELPMPFREAIILREMEGLSYQEIARICGVAIGTVMSRLARGRTRLYERLAERMPEGPLT